MAREPIAPPEIVAKFRNAIDARIRTKVILDPMIHNWMMVPKGGGGRSDVAIIEQNFYPAKRNQ